MMPPVSIDEARRREFERRRRTNRALSLADFLPPADDPAYLATLEELVLIDLEFAWKETPRGTSGPTIEPYLADFPRLNDRPIVFRLLRYEYELRLAHGASTVLDDYRRRFPHWLTTGLEFLDPREASPHETLSHATARTSDGTPPTPISDVALVDPAPLDPRADWLAAARGLDAPSKSELAAALVAQRKLTPFQAQRLLAGRGDSLILGEYVLLDELGAGGMGCVYKAEHRRMKRVVALKTISPAAMRDEHAIRRFQREAQAVARLEHPNIVTAHDAGQSGDTHFLVMQFVDGVDLHRLVKRSGPLDVAAALNHIAQAAAGLAFVHAAGIVHRDIKPANLLLDVKGTIKILDLGLARLDSGVDVLTSTEQMMGTVDFMSPEQAANSKSVDPSADVYSLGCTLWYLLTGRPVFEADSALERVLAHRERPIPSLAAAKPEVPAAVAALFERMLAKRPADRPTMPEVIAALQPFVGTIPVQQTLASPTRASPLGARTERSSPRRAVAVALVALSLAALGAWLMLRPGDGPTTGVDAATDGAPSQADQARLAELNRRLAAFSGLDAELTALEELGKAYTGAKDTIFGSEPEKVRSESLRHLAKLRTYDLTDEERALVTKIDAQADKFTFYPEELYVPVKQLAEMLAARKKALSEERDPLTTK